MPEFTAVRVVFQMIKHTQEGLSSAVRLGGVTVKKKKKIHFKTVPASSLVLIPVKLFLYMHCPIISPQHHTTPTHTEWCQWFYIVLKLQMQVRSGYITLIRKHFVKLLFIPWAQKQSDSWVSELFHASGTANH